MLQPATLAEMQVDYVQDGSGALYGLGAASFPVPQNLENWGHNGDLIYKSIALYFPSENMSLAVQQNDDRSFDPTNPNSVEYDGNDVFLALLLAYLNYSPPSATGEVVLPNELAIYPNPTGSSFQLVFGGDRQPDFPLTVVLTDMAGRIMSSQILDNDGDMIDVDDLPMGVYVVRTGAFSGIVIVSLK